MKLIGFVFLIFFGLLILYFVGPKVHFDPLNVSYSELTTPLNELDIYIANQESKYDIRSNCESKIYWRDSTKKATPYALLYLHGFSASALEGDPYHFDYADRFGMNLYIPRLSEHGLNSDSTFLHLTPNGYLQSAIDALEIATKIGKKVIIMSCSTGGTLSNYLAATYPDKVHAQIMYAPNIRIRDKRAELTIGPWGKYLLQKTAGGNLIPPDTGSSTKESEIWDQGYHINGVLALQTMLRDISVDSIFEKIEQPLFVGVYYKNKDEQDTQVSVEAIDEFYSKVSTPLNKKWIRKYADAGDHVFISKHKKDSYIEKPYKDAVAFSQRILKLKPVKKK